MKRITIIYDGEDGTLKFSTPESLPKDVYDELRKRLEAVEPKHHPELERLEMPPNHIVNQCSTSPQNG